MAGELCAAPRWVYESCARLGAAESECPALQLTVEEVCTNLIGYGYGARGGPVERRQDTAMQALFFDEARFTGDALLDPPG
ncbi:MAG: hypothetical protein ACREX9_24090 [Gammaproteobacteria bacterium]